MPVIRFAPSGWQGRFDGDFSEANVTRVAGAIGAIWSQRYGDARVYVGYDRRYHAESFALLIGKALAAFGLQPQVSLGACPLPAVEWAAANDSHAAGALMVTASESPCEYGGIIARGKDGGPVTSAFAREVERRVLANPLPTYGEVERADLVKPYLDNLLSYFDTDLIRSAQLRIVLDPMYGAASGVLYSALETMGCSVTEIHGDRREDFDGLHPKPVEPWVDECEQLVICQHADVGFVLDGDGDRASLIDEKGRLIVAHNLAPLILSYLVEYHGLRGRVVTTLASSMRTVSQAKRLGLEVTQVPVGFDRLYAEVRQGDVVMAAEEYGGICIPAHLYERDGLLSCLLVLELLAQEKRPLSELVDELSERLGSMSYIRRDLRLDSAASQTLRNLLPGLNPPTLAGMEPISVNHAEGLRVQFKNGSWAMLRPSRSGSYVRVYAEAANAEARDALIEAMSQLAKHPHIWKHHGE
ncbi:phosphoglucomutase/phosphomannomutase, alpha/beta/alpha domain II, partial [Atopobium sp. oral taxon 810]|uniref:phosphoglucomutase/phosphomannomutase, alpha/beta/alpha domain II n=1 Tax=Atopobium sp. oral taxon 810 TaxID=712158 RepID=UPI000395F0E4